MNDNLSSMITPKNLVKDNLSRVMPLRSKRVVMVDHFILYFYIFNVSLLAASQTVNFANSVLRIPITSSIFLPSMKTLVSSANRIENNLSDTLGRSLMQIKKNSGSKTDPCGTPQATVFEVNLDKQWLYTLLCTVIIHTRIYITAHFMRVPGKIMLKSFATWSNYESLIVRTVAFPVQVAYWI